MGGVAVGTLTGLWVLRRRGASIPVFMDAAAPALLVAQAIGRIGDYFNQEMFGGPTTLPWGLEISPAHRPVGYLQYARRSPCRWWSARARRLWPGVTYQRQTRNRRRAHRVTNIGRSSASRTPPPSAVTTTSMSP